MENGSGDFVPGRYAKWKMEKGACGAFFEPDGP